MVISIIGGDLRQLTIYKLFRKEGHKIKLCGFENSENAELCSNFEDALSSEVIILPMPVCASEGVLNSPFSGGKIYINDLLEKINPEAVVFGGKFTNHLKGELDARKIKYFDYLDREELALKNAVPTAEGAIELAMRELPITLFGASALVVGYGRIGRALTVRLNALGSNVTVSARRCDSLAAANTEGAQILKISELDGNADSFDVIFNTVPAEVLGKELISQIPKNTLIIDLASKPGGVDFEAAKELGLSVIWALSLPGKVAPISSGTYIKECICNIISETGCCK